MKIVSNLKEKKSPGHDGIDNQLLKSIIPYIVDPLVYIVNLSLTHGIVPNNMKTAKVIPIYTKGDHCDVNNYRPISLLTSISKVLERIIYIRTINFLNKFDIFCNFQFGFREKHNTSHALLTFVEKVTHALDKFSHTVGIFLDFSKAFDTINHEILLAKLSHYGIRGKALEWFRSYLSNRSQYVSLNGSTSQNEVVDCGVPQGSCSVRYYLLSTLMTFTDPPKICNLYYLSMTRTSFFPIQTANVLLRNINTELSHVTQWIRANKLSLNIQETKCMLFSRVVRSPSR